MNNKELREKLRAATYARDALPEMGEAMLDISFPCTPAIRFLCATEGQAKHVADVLETRILQALSDVLEGRKYETRAMFLRDDEQFASARFRSVEQRFKPIEETLAELREAIPQPVISDDPKPGWWRVDSLRRGIILKAGSQRDAVNKAYEHLGYVDDADFIGETLPEVIQC